MLLFINRKQQVIAEGVSTMGARSSGLEGRTLIGALSQYLWILAFRAGGDRVDFRALPEFRSEGHWLAETDGGEEIFGPTLDNAMKAIMAKPARAR